MSGPGTVRPTGWAAPLLGALGVAAGFLTFAYLSWVQVAGRVSWLGVSMVVLNLAVAVAAVAGGGRALRAGRAPIAGWLVVAVLVVAGVVLYPFMGTLA